MQESYFTKKNPVSSSRIPIVSSISKSNGKKVYTLGLLFNAKAWKTLWDKHGFDFYKNNIDDQVKIISNTMSNEGATIETSILKENLQPVEALNPDLFDTHQDRLQAFLNLDR